MPLYSVLTHSGVAMGWKEWTAQGTNQEVAAIMGVKYAPKMRRKILL